MSFKEELTKDADNMLKIQNRLGDRDDIWQDRFIYWMAKAIWDILNWINRQK